MRSTATITGTPIIDMVDDNGNVSYHIWVSNEDGMQLLAIVPFGQALPRLTELDYKPL